MTEIHEDPPPVLNRKFRVVGILGTIVCMLGMGFFGLVAGVMAAGVYWMSHLEDSGKLVLLTDDQEVPAQGYAVLLKSETDDESQALSFVRNGKVIVDEVKIDNKLTKSEFLVSWRIKADDSEEVRSVFDLIPTRFWVILVIYMVYLFAGFFIGLRFFREIRRGRIFSHATVLCIGAMAVWVLLRVTFADTLFHTMLFLFLAVLSWSIHEARKDRQENALTI